MLEPEFIGPKLEPESKGPQLLAPLIGPQLELLPPQPLLLLPKNADAEVAATTVAIAIAFVTFFICLSFLELLFYI
jgi:hypothetical protein